MTGGKVKKHRAGPTLAAAMRDLLVELGVDREDILVEEESRTTHENAVRSAEILRQHEQESIRLVTDGIRLHRAVLSFRRQGLNVTPEGSHYIATSMSFTLSDFIPSSRALGNVELACHEWLGIAWYWLQGRI